LRQIRANILNSHINKNIQNFHYVTIDWDWQIVQANNVTLSL